MRRISPDRQYALFMNEAREEAENFYFVKLFDEPLYQRLCEAERSAKINIKSSGSALRGALENFMRNALPETCQSELLASSAVRRHQKTVQSADIVDYQNFFEKHPGLGVDAALFHQVRIVGNLFSHEKEGKSNMPRTYETLCRGLSSMHKMLLQYYTQKAPEKMRKIIVSTYNRDRQPYGDWEVCSVMDTLDSTACEKQVLCSRRDDRQPDLLHYSLLRVYQAQFASEGAIRDEKVLSSLWGNSLRDIPNIVRYSPLHVDYNGDDPKREKKYIVSYDFGPHKPFLLHTKLLEQLSEAQKTMLLHDIAAGVQVLHHAGMYHRNLQPSSAFVFFDRNSDFVQAKLVGFEYCKITGDNATVYAHVAKLQQEASTAFFSATMKQALKNRQAASRVDWSCEDIYSLGALYYFILTGRPPQGGYLPGDLPGADEELKQLIRDMLSPVVTKRPKIDTVLAYIERRYNAVL